MIFRTIVDFLVGKFRALPVMVFSGPCWRCFGINLIQWKWLTHLHVGEFIMSEQRIYNRKASHGFEVVIHMAARVLMML